MYNTLTIPVSATVRNVISVGATIVAIDKLGVELKCVVTRF